MLNTCSASRDLNRLNFRNSVLCLSSSDPVRTVAQGRKLKRGKEESEVKVIEKMERRQNEDK
jgi:hypothetical protein